jgi:DNA replication and repair protein RecF
LPLTRARIQSLRCLTEVELALHPVRNYLLGPNGAGKTSLLEAIYLLGRGRSFRTRQLRRLVQRGTAGFSVYAELVSRGQAHRVGVASTGGKLEKKIDGEEAGGTAALAALFPVHAIDPGIHELIQGTPSDRRRFLDWGVFHVEHGYLDGWRQYRRILGQRNAALKARASAAELDAWDDALGEAAARVHGSRDRYVKLLTPELVRSGQALLGQELTLDYRPGWDATASLNAALRAGRDRDSQVGNTEAGPHRADLVVQLDGRPAQNEASRGQQKLAAAALILAQVAVYSERVGVPGTLLVDDPAAELDAGALQRLLRELERTPSQLLITGLDRSQMPVQSGFPVFHVERGKVERL